MQGGFNIIKNAVEVLLSKTLNLPQKKTLSKGCPKSLILCEPQMSKRNLYPSLGIKNARSKKVKNIMNFLQYADGTNSLKKISKLIKINLVTCNYINTLLKKKLLVK